MTFKRQTPQKSLMPQKEQKKRNKKKIEQKCSFHWLSLKEGIKKYKKKIKI